MTFIRNIWYVAAWNHEVGDTPIGRQVIGQPIVLWRGPDGRCVAMEDRCSHRRALLSMGRVEDGTLRCMYHGLKFDQDGRCVSVPATDRIPPNSTVTTYPLEERDGWLWMWLGDPALADPALIPKAFGLDGEWRMMSGVIDYDADYSLVNDNLTDLSHVDYTHETSIGAVSGACWSDKEPDIEVLANGLRISRWMVTRPEKSLRPNVPPGETYCSYQYILPGVFIMRTMMFALGTAQTVNFGDPGDLTPLFQQVDQQAITPVAEGRARYFYAAGGAKEVVSPEMLEGLTKLFLQAFNEDRVMIEAQQRNWNTLGADRALAYIPQDKAPYLFRRMIAQRLEKEARGLEATVQPPEAVPAQ